MDQPQAMTARNAMQFGLALLMALTAIATAIKDREVSWPFVFFALLASVNLTLGLMQ